MQKGLVWLLKHRLRSEAQGSGEKKSLKKCLMSQWLCYAKIHRHFKVSSGCKKKEVEAPLDIKDVIHQISCFSKTIVMNITLPSVGRTSAHDVRPLAMTFLLFLSRGYNLKHDSV